jgi:predicted nucleic acid-binding protein
MVYADSSFLVSAFGSDANSVQAVNLLAAANQPIAFTDLHKLEISNALELAVFRGSHTRAEVKASWSQLLRAVRQKALVTVIIDWRSILRAASRLATQHSATMGTRSYDITHVAVARHLRLKTFYSFDKRQRTLAARLGMKLEPPTL